MDFKKSVAGNLPHDARRPFRINGSGMVARLKLTPQNAKLCSGGGVTTRRRSHLLKKAIIGRPMQPRPT
jgi:hypothetical protein